MMNVWINTPWRDKRLQTKSHIVPRFEEAYDEKVAIHLQPNRSVSAILHDVGIAPPFASRHAGYEAHQRPRSLQTSFFALPQNAPRQHTLEAFTEA
ncbi:MAG: hypothetical protein ACKO37_01270 [Vampirovibrionales bacterium]